MTTILTPRLLLREIEPYDAGDMFELDADPEVHRYLGGAPVTSMDQIHQVIQMIRRQYADFGVARLAVTDRCNGAFLGWCGLKFITDTVNNHTRYHDLGYRFIRKFWGKGYATEAAIACRDFGFNELGLQEMFAIADMGNDASKHVLEKTGFRFVETFDYEGDKHGWFELRR